MHRSASGSIRFWMEDNMLAAWLPWLLWLLSVVVLNTGCSSGGGNGDGGGGGGSYVWVVIENPGSDTTLDTASADLSGRASCPDCPASETAFGYCPPIRGFVPGGAINVAWTNHSSGASGVALFQGISGSCSCLFSYCTVSYHRGWTASIPLQAGSNAIEVTASDAQGAPGSDTITITRVPPAPGGVTTTAEHGQLTVSWNSVAEATSYNLYWSTSRTFTKESGTKISGVTSPYLHPGLTDGVTYYYLVTAVNGAYESFPSPVVSATAGWASQSVTATLATTNQRTLSLAVDSAGHAHIHYSYDDGINFPNQRYNYYATNAGGSFAPVVVDNPAWINASIALEPNDSVHVSYLDSAGITHAVYTSGTWSAQAVDAQAWCDGAFVLDAAGKAHLAYRANSAAGQKLRYATNVSGSWVTSDVASYATAGCSYEGRQISIAVDTAGVAHISYAGEYPDYGLLYTTNEGGNWAISTVAADYILQSSLAVDQNRKVHVVYSNNAYEVRYANNVSGGWSSEAIESVGQSLSPSLALDANGKAHVSYFYNWYGELRYAHNNGGAWQVAVIADAGSASASYRTNTAIAIDTQGKIHIGYFNNDTGHLSYATNK